MTYPTAFEEKAKAFANEWLLSNMSYEQMQAEVIQLMQWAHEMGMAEGAMTELKACLFICETKETQDAIRAEGQGLTPNDKTYLQGRVNQAIEIASDIRERCENE